MVRYNVISVDSEGYCNRGLDLDYDTLEGALMSLQCIRRELDLCVEDYAISIQKVSTEILDEFTVKLIV